MGSLPAPEVKVGKNVSTCGCGQEEKVAVLVGCTQHGKSSLIRSILDYGGCTDEADQVKCGAFGNSSTTKHAKEYSVAINIKNHALEDTDGQPRSIDLNDEEPDDLYELKAASSHTRRHLHLRIIDTPGLDDSDNAKQSDDDRELGDFGLQVRAVDQRHKLIVLKALANVAKLHAVCFVLDMGNNLGASIQNLLREYMDIFEMSGVAKSYHFAHTKVDVNTLFSKKARDRPSTVDATFGIKGRTKHHYINNLPEEGDDVSQHFAHWGLAKLFTDLTREKAQNVGGLKYPKTEGHKSMDEALRMMFKAKENLLEAEIKREKTHRENSQSVKRSLESRKTSENESWLALWGKVKELDTEDLVQIGYESKYERDHFMAASRLYFYVTSSSPIRDFELDHCSDSFWSQGGPDRSDVVGSTSCSATLIGNGWFTSIQGSITLLGWKKEAKADELQTLRTEEGSAWDDYQATEKRIRELTKEINETEGRILDLDSELVLVRKKRANITGDVIPMDMLGSRAPYCASPSIISYTFALQTTAKFPISLLLGGYSIKGGSYTAKYKTQHDTAASKLAIISKATQRVKASQRRLLTSLRSLEDKSNSLDTVSSAAKTDLKDVGNWKPTSDYGFMGAYALDGQRVLGAIQADILPRVTRGKAILGDVVAEKVEMIYQRQRFLSKAIAKQRILLLEADELERGLEDQAAQLRATIAAADLTKTIINRDVQCVGVLSVLKQSVDRQRPDQWEDVFLHFRKVYSCDSEQFNGIRTMCT